MSDSRARRVAQVNVPAPRRSRFGGSAFVGGVAIAALALIVGFSVLRGGPENVPASSPTPSPSSSAAAIASATQSAAASVAPSAPASPSSASGSVVPDTQHGIITFENIRTEADPTGLQQPPQFTRTSAASFTVAVSPDGTRVAMIVGNDGAQRIIIFTTARPNDVATVVDFTGTGEVARRLVWAGDGQGSLLLNAQKESRGQGGGDNLIVDYSTIRSVDVGSRQMTEIMRVSGRSITLFPLAWLPGRQVAAAIEMLPLGPSGDYVVVRGTAVERTPMPGANVLSFNASRDGTRVTAAFSPAIRWWPVDQPVAAKELLAASNGRAEYAAFRPGADELGVSVAAASAGAVGPPGHFEIWSLSGQQRVVSTTVGFSFWRADGSAAISGSTLIDPSNGATTPLPGGAFKIVDVVLF